MLARILGIDPGCASTGLCNLEMDDRTLRLAHKNPTEAFSVLCAHSSDEMVNLITLAVQRACTEAQLRGAGLVIALESAIPPRRALRQWEDTAQVRGAVKSANGLFGPAELFEMTSTAARRAIGLPSLTRDDRLLRQLNRKEFVRSADMRTRQHFCRITGLPEEIFKGKNGCHKVDAGVVATAVAWRHLRAQNERLVA